jgi:hypothetical protein
LREFIFPLLSSLLALTVAKVSSSPNHFEIEKTKRLCQPNSSAQNFCAKKYHNWTHDLSRNDFNNNQQQQQVMAPQQFAPYTRRYQVDVIEYYCHLCLMETDPLVLKIL